MLPNKTELVGSLLTSLLATEVVVSLQQFNHAGLIHTVSSEQLMLRCVCYLNSEKHLLGLQFGVQLILMNLSSAAEVTLGLPFLWRSSWEPDSSKRLMVFVTALEETFKVFEMFPIDWPSCFKVLMDCRFSLLKLFLMMDLVFYQIGLSSVYHPYLVTTQLMGSNSLRRKELPQMNF